MPRKAPGSKNYGIQAGGNIKAGGDMAGRDISKTTFQSNMTNPEIHVLFADIYDLISGKKELPPDKQAKLTKAVQSLETNVAKKVKDKSKIESILTNIAKMAPDIFDVVVTTLANPILGLGMVARKIAKKASNEA